MDEIVKALVAMSGRYNYHMIFQDWICATAIAIQNACWPHDWLWRQREQQYTEIMNKYTKQEQKQFPRLTTMLCEMYEKDGITDALGQIYMSQQSGNKRLGQFFTPFHVSELCAEIGMQQKLKETKEGERIQLYEPSAGAGGMPLAACKYLGKIGINYQRKLMITAQDLDWNGVYMTYVQLSLVGADAVVVQGDTLKKTYKAGEMPEENIFYTPMRMGVLA